jgi:hypothetical protein
MSNSIQSVQSAHVHAQTEHAVQPSRILQTTSQNSVPQETVTISKPSQQAHAGNTNAVASHDKDHDGDNA